MSAPCLAFKPDTRATRDAASNSPAPGTDPNGPG